MPHFSRINIYEVLISFALEVIDLFPYSIITLITYKEAS